MYGSDMRKVHIASSKGFQNYYPVYSSGASARKSVNCRADGTLVSEYFSQLANRATYYFLMILFFFPPSGY